MKPSLKRFYFLYGDRIRKMFFEAPPNSKHFEVRQKTHK